MQSTRTSGEAPGRATRSHGSAPHPSLPASRTAINGTPSAVQKVGSYTSGPRSMAPLDSRSSDRSRPSDIIIQESTPRTRMTMASSSKHTLGTPSVRTPPAECTPSTDRQDRCSSARTTDAYKSNFFQESPDKTTDVSESETDRRMERKTSKRSANVARGGPVKKLKAEAGMATAPTTLSPRRSSRAVMPSRRFKDMEMISFGKRKSGKEKVRVEVQAEEVDYTDIRVDQQAESDTITEEIITEESVIDDSLQMNLMDEMLVLPLSSISSSTSTIISAQSIDTTQETESSIVRQSDSTPKAITFDAKTPSMLTTTEHRSVESRVVHVSAKQTTAGPVSSSISSASHTRPVTLIENPLPESFYIRMEINPDGIAAAEKKDNCAADATNIIGSADSSTLGSPPKEQKHVTIVTKSVIGGTNTIPDSKLPAVGMKAQHGGLSKVIIISPETLKHSAQNPKLSSLHNAMQKHKNGNMFDYQTGGEILDVQTIVSKSACSKTDLEKSDAVVVDDPLIALNKGEDNIAEQPCCALDTDRRAVSEISSGLVTSVSNISSNLIGNYVINTKEKDMITKGQVVHVSPAKLQTVSQSLLQSRLTASSQSVPQKKHPTAQKSIIIKRQDADARHPIPQIMKIPVVHKERMAGTYGGRPKHIEYRYEKVTPQPVDTYVTHVRIAPMSTAQGEPTVQTLSVDTNAQRAVASVEEKPVVTVVEAQQFTDISPIAETIISTDAGISTTTDSEIQFSVVECQQITEMTNVSNNVEPILTCAEVDIKQIENVSELDGIQHVIPGSSTELPMGIPPTENTFCEVIEYGKQASGQTEGQTAIEYVMLGDNLVPIHKPAPSTNIWTQGNRMSVKKPGRVDGVLKQPETRQAKVKPIPTKEAESLINQLIEEAKAGTLDIHNAVEVVSMVTKGDGMKLDGHVLAVDDQAHVKAFGGPDTQHNQSNTDTFTAHGHIERPDPNARPANVTEISEVTFAKEVYRDDVSVLTQPSTGATDVDPETESALSAVMADPVIVTAGPRSHVATVQPAMGYTSVTATQSQPVEAQTHTQSAEIGETILSRTPAACHMTLCGTTGLTNVDSQVVGDEEVRGKQSLHNLESRQDETIVKIQLVEGQTGQEGDSSTELTVMNQETEYRLQKPEQASNEVYILRIDESGFGNHVKIVSEPIRKTIFPRQGTTLKTDNIITIGPEKPVVVSHTDAYSQKSTAGTQTPVAMRTDTVETETGTETGEGSGGDTDGDDQEGNDVDNEVGLQEESSDGPKIITVNMRQKPAAPITQASSQEYVVVHLPEGTEVKSANKWRPVKVDLGIRDDQIPMSADGKYLCEDCPYVTDKKPNWFKHKRKHLGIKPHACPRCSYKASTSSNLKRHLMIHDDIRDFHCTVCGLMFRQKIHLERHIKYRHKEKKVKCPLCDYQCSSENPDLKIHMRRRHMPGEDGTIAAFTCDECGLMTVSRKDLRQHKKFHRKGPELKLFCEYCSFVTDCESRLRRHMLVHTKEKPFQCGLCEYRATQKEHVLRHMRSQHDIEVVRKARKVEQMEVVQDENEESINGDAETEKDRPFDKADYSSNDKIFACNHCLMKFSKLINLYKHLYTQHKNVMPDPAVQDFQCVVCDFTTNNKKNLLVHMRKHNMTDQTPPSHVYSCVLCRYMNPRRRNLFQHMKKKHGIEIVIKDDGTANCYLTDQSPIFLSSEATGSSMIPLNEITTTQSLDEAGNFVDTDNDSQLRIVTEDRTMSFQPGTISIDSIISVEDMATYVSNNPAILPAMSEAPIHGSTMSLYEQPSVEHKAAEAIEGLQALAQQAGILEMQAVDNDVTSEVVASEMLDQADLVAAEETAESPSDKEIQLSSEQINQLSSGDFVEIDGEVYKVEISSQEQTLL